MVESFHIREEDAVRVFEAPLREATAGLFRHAGLSDEDAALAADVVVAADRRGVDSHGVSNMLKIYLDRYAEGSQNPRPRWKIVRERAATANVDADKGLGIVMAPKAMDIAIEKARQTGIGVVTLFNAGHIGMAAYHAMLTLPHDMVGICMTATNPQVLPTFGREPRLGTNPVAVAAPAKDEPPFVFDMATSVVPINKLRNAKRMGSTLPPGMIAGADGVPIMVPVPVPDDYWVLPLGSTRDLGSHKGYGLAMVVDILCSVMAGADYGARAGYNHYRNFLAAFHVDAFTDVDGFKQEMDDFLREMKATPPAPGHDRVLVAGQPEWEMEQERRERGIPLHREVVDWLRSICAEANVPCAV